MTKILLNKLFQIIEITPPDSLSKGLARKILMFELMKPRHFLVFLSLPSGIYFAVKFVIEIITNQLLSTGWLAISNFSPSLEYVASEIYFINAFFPYQTFSFMLVALIALAWSGWTIKKQLNHIVRLKHII